MSTTGGIDAVLSGLPRTVFPMDKEQLCVTIGDLEVSDVSGHRIAVRRLLDRVDAQRFESPEDVTEALEMAVALEAERTLAD
jgi:hypothetical protein